MSFLRRLLATRGVVCSVASFEPITQRNAQRNAFVTRLAFVLAFTLAIFTALSSIACGRSQFDFEDQGADSGVDSCVGLSCNDTGVDTDGDTKTLVSINVLPASQTLVPGSTSTFTAQAFYSDGTSADVTATAVWTSDDPKVVTVASNKATAVAAGEARIRATLGSVFGEADIIVTKATVKSVQVSPPAVLLAVGTTQRMTATAFFSDGTKADVTTSSAWSSSSDIIASVDGTGLVEGIGPGTAKVQAVFAGMTGVSTVTVSGKTVTRIDVSPFSPTIPVGGSVNLTATAIFSDGTKSDVTTTATWSASPPDVATVTSGGPSSGTVVGLKGGSAVVTATFSGVSGSTPVTVNASPVVAVTVNPTAATTSPGGTVLFTAQVHFADGTSSDITTSASWASSDATVATVSTGQAKALAVGSANITATFAGFTGSATLTVSPATLVSVTCSPSSVTIPIGTTSPLKATGVFSDGSTRDVTADVSWSTDDPTVATVDTTGLATPVAPGATTARAKEAGFEGDCAITVVKAAVTSITITPNPMSLVVGDKQFAKASATYSDGTVIDVSATCTWSSASATVASVSNGPGAQGQVTGVGAGSTTISCTLDGVTGSATVNVTGATLASISVSPIAPTCHVGDTLQFVAQAIDTSGKSTNVTFAAAWSSDNTSVITPLGPPGRFRCVGAGTANVIASYSGLTGSTPVTVSDAVVTSIQVDPIDASRAVGEVQQYQAVAFFSDGTSANVTGTSTWVSTSPSVASIGDAGFNKGRATMLSPGTTTIQATYKGVTGSTSLTVTTATVVSISITPSSASVAVGTTFRYTAQAIYSDGTSRDVTGAATWTSSDNSVASVSDAGGTKGQVTTLASGSVTISATYSGVTGNASLTVTAATITSIQVTPFSASVAQGTPVQFRASAIYSDGTSVDVTGAATWVSSDSTVASVSDAAGSKGRAQALKAGSVKISATYKGVTGSATLTVTSATLTRIQVTPFSPSIPAGFYLQLQATGIYSDGTTADLTYIATWTSTDPTIASVSDAGFFKGVVQANAPGTVTISATYNGVTGTDSVNVNTATLTSITISPDPASVSVGSDTQLTATGTFSDGSSFDITFYVTWLTSDTSIADVSNGSDTKGLAHGFKAGTVTVTAQRGSVTGTSTMNVK